MIPAIRIIKLMQRIAIRMGEPPNMIRQASCVIRH
jgi:hypothetical protein